MKATTAAHLALCGTLVGACSDGSGPEARRLADLELEAPAQMEDGDTIRATATYLDQNGEAFASAPSGTTLTWTSSDASVLSVLPDGRVAAQRPGDARITARASEEIHASVDISVSPVPTAVVAVAGQEQDGLPGDVLPDSVTLRVIDRHDDPVAGVDVTFAVATGGGSVSPSTATSDVNGLVHVQWTLGPEANAQQISVHADGVALPLEVTATMSSVVLGSVALPGTAAVGATLDGQVRLNSSFYAVAIGASSMVVRWDPAMLELQPAALGAGDFAGWSSWYNNSSGELHMVATDPDATIGDLAHTHLAFTALAAGATTITVEMPTLVAANFNPASSAARAESHQITID